MVDAIVEVLVTYSITVSRRVYDVTVEGFMTL